MLRVADYIFAIVITLWVGALWAIGYIAAPTLFYSLADRSLAGAIAGKQFATVAWLGMACAAYVIGFLIYREGGRAFKTHVLWLVVLMLLFTLAGHFGIRPILEQLSAEPVREVLEGVMRSRFQAWHGVASVLWLIQSVLGVGLVTQVFKR
jgi:hypothetical protein